MIPISKCWVLGEFASRKKVKNNKEDTQHQSLTSTYMYMYTPHMQVHIQIYTYITQTQKVSNQNATFEYFKSHCQLDVLKTWGKCEKSERV